MASNVSNVPVLKKTFMRPVVMFVAYYSKLHTRMRTGVYTQGRGVAQDSAEALRLHQLAAAQGHPFALFCVAQCHELGAGVGENREEAIRWYRRAQAAGDVNAPVALQRLRA